MKTEQQQFGVLGENTAAQHYTARGAVVKERNVRYAFGEIDLIVEEPDGTVVLVEVKTRHGHDFGGAEAVTTAKLSRLRRAAAKWLEGQPFLDIRFDVVVVIVDRHTGDVDISTYEGVTHGAR